MILLSLSNVLLPHMHVDGVKQLVVSVDAKIADLQNTDVHVRGICLSYTLHYMH